MDLIHKLVKWAVFSVVIALLPIGFNALRLSIRSYEITLGALTGHGELLLIASAISAAALGELIPSGPKYRTWKLLGGGGCIIAISLASLTFADVSAAIQMEQVIESENVAVISSWLLAASVLSSGFSVGLTEVRE